MAVLIPCMTVRDSGLGGWEGGDGVPGEVGVMGKGLGSRRGKGYMGKGWGSRRRRDYLEGLVF